MKVELIKIRRFIIALRWVCLVMSLFSLLFSDSNNSIFIGFWISIWILLAIIFSFLKSCKITGDIIFLNDKIEINHLHGPKLILDTITFLKVQLRGYKGQRIPHLINLFHLDVDKYHGINMIEIITVNSRHSYLFLLRSQENYNHFSKILSVYEKKEIGIEIRQRGGWF